MLIAENALDAREHARMAKRSDYCDVSDHYAKLIRDVQDILICRFPDDRDRYAA